MNNVMWSERGFNFGAGPATLPIEVLQEVQEELLNWQGKGMSILELGHRTPEFISLLHEAEQNLRELLNIPQNYHVLFLGGPTRNHFAMLPMNILGQGHGAYWVSGIWSKMALEEAQQVASAYCLATSEDEGFSTFPELNTNQIKPNTRYVYYTPNETINGIKSPYPSRKIIGNIPVVADMTSCLLTEEININDYAMIIAGAQKNIAPAGMTLVIVCNDFLQQKSVQHLPKIFDYRTHIQHQSLYTTPPVFNCYFAEKVFAWIKQKGGVKHMQLMHEIHANRLYRLIDHSSIYQPIVDTKARSPINICFRLNPPHLTEQFLDEAAQKGLFALKGHAKVGGVRASLYNAMTDEGVEQLCQFMQCFEGKFNSCPP